MRGRIISNLVVLVFLSAYLISLFFILSVLLFIETISYNWLVVLPILIMGPILIIRRFISPVYYIISATFMITILILLRFAVDLWLPVP